MLQTLNEVAPQLAHAVPTLITLIGAVVAACSTPPALGEMP